MNRLAKMAVATAATALATISGPALAQSKCDSILVNGTLKISDLKKSRSYLQILYSRFMRTTYAEARSSRDTDGEATYGPIMGSGEYSEAQYKAKKEAIQKSDLKIIQENDFLSAYLSSGDPVIVNAWSACMATEGGGLSIRFKPRSATELTAIVEFRLVGRHNMTKLTSDIKLPDVREEDISDPKCFRSGTVIRAGVPCVSTIRLQDAWQTLNVAANSTEGSAEAYLPARIKLTRKREVLRFTTRNDRLYEQFFRLGRVDRSRTFALAAHEIEDGWMLQPDTARATVHVLKNHGSMNWCKNVRSKAGPWTWTYGYQSNSERRGHSGWSIWCQMNLSIMKERDVWEPDSI